MSNVRLTKNFRIPVMMVSERYDFPVVVQYAATVRMITHTECEVEQNVAYDRIRFWIQAIMTDSVLIAHDHAKLDTWLKTGARCMILPQDPVDQLVGIMLLCKLNSIAEGRIGVEEVELSSVLDDDIVYHCAADEDLGPFSVAGWWRDTKPTCSELPIRKQRGKVISLKRSDSWKEYGMDWDQEDREAQILIADFGHDEKK